MYEDLEEYQGEKIRCDNPGCGREFTEGEVITVDEEKGMVFCYTGENGGCLIAYVFSTGKVCAGNTMRFRGSKWRVPENPMPNYPNMPIAHKERGEENKKKAEQESWLRKVLGGLGL